MAEKRGRWGGRRAKLATQVEDGVVTHELEEPVVEPFQAPVQSIPHPLERLAAAARELEAAFDALQPSVLNDIGGPLIPVTRSWVKKLLRLGIEPWERRRKA